MADLAPTRLLLVGCGKMGGAMLRGWLARGLAPAHAVIVEPTPAGLEELTGRGVRLLATSEAIPADFRPDVVVLAVKPQMMDGAIAGYARFTRPETLFLSIAAGKTIAYFQRHLGPAAAVVRAMPNTPAAIGRGISVAVASPPVTAAQRALADALLAACGEVAWVEEEGLIDPVTALVRRRSGLCLPPDRDPGGGGAQGGPARRSRAPAGAGDGLGRGRAGAALAGIRRRSSAATSPAPRAPRWRPSIS